MRVNDFRYFYYLGKTFSFDCEWIKVANDRFVMHDRYHDFLIPSDSFCIFENNRGDFLFGFNNLKSYKVGSRPYDYELIIDNNKYIINNVHYSLLGNLVTTPKNSNKGIFVFSKNEKIDYPTIEGSSIRCDYGMNGPIAFSGPAGPSEISFDFKDPAPVTLDHTYTTSSVISCFGVGNIVYMELIDETIESEAINDREVPCITRTFAEQLKLIIEWAELVEKPFNSKQDISLLASEFLKQYNMSKDVKDDLWKNQADMQVVRFLKGDKKARQRPALAEIKEISFLQKRWALSKFIYKGYDNMKSILGNQL